VELLRAGLLFGQVVLIADALLILWLARDLVRTERPTSRRLRFARLVCMNTSVFLAAVAMCLAWVAQRLGGEYGFLLCVLAFGPIGILLLLDGALLTTLRRKEVSGREERVASTN
jgi:hypothetical protein